MAGGEMPKIKGHKWPAIGDRKITGNTFFVDSGIGLDDPGYGKSPDKPFATIDYAVGKCTASNGDYIFVMPGHTETVSAAAGIDLDVAGITIEGLGNGANRPTISFGTATTADMDIDAANITVRNLNLAVAIDSLAAMVDVNSTDFKMEDCYLYEGSTDLQALTFIDINGGAANACDRAKIYNCKIMQTGSTTAVGDRGIELGEVADEVEIVGCVIDGDWDDAGIHNITGKVMTNLLIKDCIVANRATGQHAIELVSACTGFAINNMLYGDTRGTILDPGSLKCIGNKEVAAIDSVAIDSPYVLAAGGMVDENANYLAVTADTSTTTWGKVASHEIATVTGTVRMRIIPEVTTHLGSGDAALICLGYAGDTDAFIGNSTATSIDKGDIWLEATAASHSPSPAFSSLVDRIVSNGVDVGYEVKTSALTAGSITFHIWWTPLSSTGAVTAGAGGSL